MQYEPAARLPVHSRGGSRRWLFLILFLVIAAGGWSAFWFYAADRANTALVGWLQREERAGRVYSCGSQSLGGFPFRIEVRCRGAAAELRALNPPLSLRLNDVLVAAQIYQPTLLIGEWSGPLTVSENGHQPTMTASWALAQTSVRGQPRAPERVSIVLDRPVVDRAQAGTTERLLAANGAEIHGRIVSGTARENPVIDIAMRANALSAGPLHPILAAATDAEIDATLRGLEDFSPKPWSARFREIHERNGRIEIRSARVRQTDWAAAGAGSLGLSPSGRLDGELRITVAGVEKLLQQIGVDGLTRPGSENREKMNDAFNALDRIAPGLGGLAREKAAPAIAAGAVAMLGQPAELDGRKAVTLPLRFQDGAIFLGPIRVGQTAPLF
ncbi:MAG: DUF2125 domain-containing protein [Pseudorhodoplanes sp.]|nr:DUF2125 domain-containing protein [Pseudorhodoplanes sp.]MCL4709729.1 DUF2125 domain-containing protein [Pseudorhodoplanes sp.]MCQ3941609.1 hypothetical protein [Alphaproteobacteria bacterium]